MFNQGTHVLTHTQTTGSTLDADAMLHSTSPFTKSLPQPISTPDRTTAVSDTFQKAPGAEVKSKSLEDEGQVSPWYHTHHLGGGMILDLQSIVERK